MSTLKTSYLTRFVTFLPVFYLAIATAVQAAPTFWTGPIVSFSHDSFTTTADVLTPGVSLTRGDSQPLFNVAQETGWNGTTSPVDTMWVVASGPLTSANTLTYGTFANVVGQPRVHSPALSVGKTFFVHLVSEDIYLQLTLTAWGASDGGSFSYDRTSPSVAPPAPTVSLTNPPAGTVFAAPAALKLMATASVSSGTVTNVQFFANTTTSLGSATTAPFNLTSSPLSAGNYSLSAVATAAGISATSSIVNVSVVNPVNVNLSNIRIAAGQFDFNANVSTGLSYVVQSSSNMLTWLSLSTNKPAATPAAFSNSFSPQGASFYRIGLLPNP